MRWFWIDRFTEFVAGSHAVAIKAVTLSEPHVVDYDPGRASLSPSLIVEGVAQTGGLVVSQALDFRGRVVLAKLGKAVFHDLAVPGDTLIYRCEIQSMQTDGAVATATVRTEDRPIADLELMFACLDDRFAGVRLFEPSGFLRLLRSLRLFEVGRTTDGKLIAIPEHLAMTESSSPAVP